MSEMHRIGEALKRAERTVSLRPERGQRTYRSLARIERGLSCEVSEGEDRLTIDVGRALGGEGAGPNPSTVLRAALSSCLAIGIKQWAARAGIAVDAVSVAVETDMDACGQLGVADAIAPGFQAIRVEFDIRAQASRTAIEQVVATSLRYSPLIDVFLNPQAIAHRLTVTEPKTA